MRKKSVLFFTLHALVGFTATVNALTSPQFNLALKKAYTFSVTPNYSYCTDEGDKTDLTDGIIPKLLDWVKKSTVGWAHVGRVIRITVDLGKVEPIGGASFRSVAGSAGISWPASVAVLVSEDGKDFYLAGDLIEMAEGKLPPAYGRSEPFAYRTQKLHTKGRYVCFAVVPSGTYLFTDEIEIYRGNEKFLKEPNRGATVSDEQLVQANRLTRLGCIRRVRRDAETLARIVEESSSLDSTIKAGIIGEVANIKKSLASLKPTEDAKSFKAVVPLNNLHREVFRQYARLLAESKVEPITLWTSHPYEMLGLFEKPRNAKSGLNVEMIQNEHRPAVLNITNASMKEKEVSLVLRGLAAGAVSLYQVEYVDTREGEVVASALAAMNKQGGAFTTIVPAGMTRQVWFSIDSGHLKPGKHNGMVTVKCDSFQAEKAFNVDVAGLKMPDEKTCVLTMWDYIIDMNYGITRDNQAAALRDAAAHGVSAPWSGPSGLPVVNASDVDAEGNINGKIDFSRWDAYVKAWPRARYYMVFAGLHDKTSFAGKEPGTPAFARAVEQWSAAWAKHNRQIGLKPGQAVILFQDEPGDDTWFKATYLYAKAFKTGTKDILVFTDPAPNIVNSHAGLEALAQCDIVCPTLYGYNAAGPEVQAKFRDLTKQGKQLWFYMCNGPTRQYNPGHYRLQAWFALAAGGTGSGYWSYGDNGRVESSWNEYTAVGGTSFTPVYIGADTITTSKHWEAARESIQDYQYFILLEARVAELEKSGTKTSALASAKKILHTLPNSIGDLVLKQFGNDFQGSIRDNPSRLAEGGRLTILGMLKKIQ